MITQVENAEGQKGSYDLRRNIGGPEVGKTDRELSTLVEVAEV